MKSFSESKVAIHVSLEKSQCFSWKKPFAGQCLPGFLTT